MNIENIKANLQIIGTRIAKLNINNEFVFIDLNDENISREIDVSYELSPAFDVEDEENLTAQNILMYIRLKITDGELQANIDLDLEGGFIFDGTDKEQLHDMLTVNGTATLYSIARGIISSITSHMCANGTLLLPMINMFSLREELDNSDDDK